MERPRLLWFGVAALIVLAVGAAVAAMVCIRDLQSRLESAQREAELNEFAHLLAVPDEALYLDWRDLDELVRARVKSYQRCGIEQFLPYWDVLAMSAAPAKRQKWRTVGERKIEKDSALGRYSFEKIMQQRAQSACQDIVNQVSNQRGVCAWVRDHQEVYRARLRPLLARLLKARDVELREKAAEAMLVLGERSEELDAALLLIVRERHASNNLSDGLARRLRRMGCEVQAVFVEKEIAALKAEDEHEAADRLSTSVFAGQSPRKDAFGDPLPPGALMRLGTVRLRGSCGVPHFSADAKRVGGADDNGMHFWDVQTGLPVVNLDMAELGYIHEPTISADGSMIAGVLVNRSGPRTWRIVVWDAQTGREKISFGHSSEFAGFPVFLPDGRTLATAGDGRVCWWNLETGALLAEQRMSEEEKGGNRLFRPAVSRDGHYLAAIPGGSSVWLFTTGKAQRLFSLSSLEDDVDRVEFTTDGKAVLAEIGRVTSGRRVTHSLSLWDIDSGTQRWSVVGDSWVYSPEGDVAACCGGDCSVKLVTLATGEARILTRDEKFWKRPVAFSPDGTILAVSAPPGVELWDVSRSILIRSLQIPAQSDVGSLEGTFSPDGKLLAVSGRGRLIMLWETETGRRLHHLSGHTWPVYCVSASRDGSRIASSSEKEVYVWDTQTGGPVLQLPLGTRVLALSADGSLLAMGGRFRAPGESRDTIVIRQTADGSIKYKLNGHEGEITSLAFSPDGKTLISGAEDTGIRTWEVESGRLIRCYYGHEFSVMTVGFLPDNRTVYSIDQAGTVRTWDLSEGDRPGLATHRTETMQAMQAEAAAVPTNGAVAAIRSGSGELHLWRMDPWQEMFFRVGTYVRRLKGVGPMAFSPDGRLLATGFYKDRDKERETRILSVETSQDVLRLVGHGNPLAATFMPDGKRLVTGGRDTTLLVWDVAPAYQRIVKEKSALTADRRP